MTSQMGIECCGVRLLPERIDLIQGGSPVASVKKENVRSITARYMFQAERPLLQIIIGSAFLLVMLWMMLQIILTATTGGTIYIETIAGLVIPGGIGGFLLWTALKRGQVLLVEMDHGQRKFPFNRKVDQQTLLNIFKIASEMGYNVDVSSVHTLFLDHE